jgi:5-methylcytosine-specific restriction endonuclease McrA
VDHAKPASRGGSNAEWNLVPACEYCNRLKDSMTVSEFRKMVKLRVVRDLISLGRVGDDASRLKIVFWGEGYDSPLSY